MLGLTVVAFLDETKAGTFMTVVAVRNILFLGLAVVAAWQVLRPRPDRVPSER